MDTSTIPAVREANTLSASNIRIIVPDQTTLDNLKFSPDGSLQNPSFTAKWLSHEEEDLLFLTRCKGDMDVQRAHRCPAVGDTAGAVPGAEACGSAGPPYTPQKASRVVSKLVTGVLLQNTA